MKRLCIFYKDARKWIGKKVEWIICKECQKLLARGEKLRPKWSKPAKYLERPTL